MITEGHIEPLRDDCVVVRFGLMELSHLRRAAARPYNPPHRAWYGLSFHGENGMSAEDIAREARMNHMWMRVTSMGRLRGAGFEPARTGLFPHLSLRWAKMPTDTELRKLTDLFDVVTENPHPWG